MIKEKCETALIGKVTGLTKKEIEKQQQTKIIVSRQGRQINDKN